MTGVFPLKKSSSDPNISKLGDSLFYSFLRELLSLILYKGILFPNKYANSFAKIICIILKSKGFTYSFIRLLTHNYQFGCE
mgnify:CR=1 FL=1